MQSAMIGHLVWKGSDMRAFAKELKDLLIMNKVH